LHRQRVGPGHGEVGENVHRRRSRIHCSSKLSPRRTIANLTVFLRTPDQAASSRRLKRRLFTRRFEQSVEYSVPRTMSAEARKVGYYYHTLRKVRNPRLNTTRDKLKGLKVEHSARIDYAQERSGSRNPRRKPGYPILPLLRLLVSLQLFAKEVYKKTNKGLPRRIARFKSYLDFRPTARA